MNRFMNSMKMTAQMAGNSRANTRQGIVTSYDPNTYSVKVTIQPDNVTTGWISLKSAWVGNGFGLFCPPEIGDAVEVDFAEGDKSAGSAGLRFFNDVDRPLPCPSGEFWVVHKSGTFIKMLNNGSIEIVTAADLKATVGGNMTASISGDATITAAGNMLLTAAKLTVDAVTQFLKSVTVDGLFSYKSGMSGSNGSGGKGAQITGGINNMGGGISSNGIDLEDHHHTAQGANAQTTKAQA